MQNQPAMQVRNQLILVGFLTWGLVAVTHIQWSANIGFWICLGAFIVAFWLSTRDWCLGGKRLLFIAVQSLCALVATALVPSGFVPVLLVVVAGQLGGMRVLHALLWIAVQTAILGLVIEQRGAFPITLAYGTFQLFGAFTARMAQEERNAQQALAEANAELRVATGLLEMSSRAEERVRIARELHDLLGHHLTALSLNLEVASHLAEGAAKQQIEKSQALTKLLLSDVRGSVSRLREDEPVDLGVALHSIRDAVPSPVIHVEANGIRVTDAGVARDALRAVQEIVTNAVRHSGARNLWLTLGARDGGLAIDARDDGGGTDHVQFGNGLRGMRERVAETGGTMDVSSMRGHGFVVHIHLPTESIAT